MSVVPMLPDSGLHLLFHSHKLLVFGEQVDQQRARVGRRHPESPYKQTTFVRVCLPFTLFWVTTSASPVLAHSLSIPLMSLCL